MTLPSAAEDLAQPPGGQHAAVVVVGRDVADDLVRLEARVEDHDRDPLGDRRLDRLDQGLRIERGQDDAVDPGGDRALDQLDLLDAIVLLLRARAR